MNKLEERLCYDFSGPILFYYVWWVLFQAQKRGICTLYFLARDGHTLQKIAQQFCQKFNLNIDCRYLYCSRASLRMPSYHLIGKEADDLLLMDGYRVTLCSLLQRVELDSAQRMAVYNDCGIAPSDEERMLSRVELGRLRGILRKSKVLHGYIQEKSKEAYKSTIGYLKQEGLFNQSEVALVDSGWVGSMQRSLRQLLQSAGFQGKLTGFYFGMYTKPKEPEDGTYLTWLFNQHGRTRDKVLFCNNLFECLLSAPHGMTTGYAICNGKYVPLLIPTPQGNELEHINTQINNIMAYTAHKLQRIAFAEFAEGIFKEDTRQRICRYMAHPTKEEADFYGNFQFCDDITESYHCALADERQLSTLKYYSIVKRTMRRLFGFPPHILAPELFWPYGTIAFLPKWKRLWYRWNIYLWEWIRYELHR